jgi:hypothetical protein
MADITTSATIVSTTGAPITTTGAPITTTGAPSITTTGAPISTTAAPVVSGVENDLAKNASTVTAPVNKIEFNYINDTNKILFSISVVLTIIAIIIGILYIKKIITDTKYVNKTIIQIYLIISLIISIVSTILLFIRSDKIYKEIQQSKLKSKTYAKNEKTSAVMRIVNIFLSIFSFVFVIVSFEKL